jgi:hypothetical protein
LRSVGDVHKTRIPGNRVHVQPLFVHGHANQVCTKTSKEQPRVRIARFFYCLDMHWRDLRAAGENEQRLYSLDAWRECPYYSERERAALAWTEAVTLVADGHVSDAMCTMGCAPTLARKNWPT